MLLNCYRSKIDKYKARFTSMLSSKITEYYKVPVEALNLSNFFTTKIFEGNGRIELETRCLIIPMTLADVSSNQDHAVSKDLKRPSSMSTIFSSSIRSERQHGSLITDNGSIYFIINNDPSMQCELDVTDKEEADANEICHHLLVDEENDDNVESMIIFQVFDFMQKSEGHASIGFVLYELTSMTYDIVVKTVITTVINNLNNSLVLFNKITFISAFRCDMVTQTLFDLMLETKYTFEKKNYLKLKEFKKYLIFFFLKFKY